MSNAAILPDSSLEPRALVSNRGLGTGAVAALAAAAPLPCLFRNNCIEVEGNPGRNGLSSYEKKRAYGIAENVKHLVTKYGLERCGFLTLTFPEDLTWKQAGERFHSLRSNLFAELFLEYLCVLEFTKRGRPHFHLVVVCKDDIRSGFNFEHYSQVVVWSRNGRQGKKPVGTLNRSPELLRLHETLGQRLPGYDFGRSELVPIKSNAEAIGRYVGGYLSKSVGNRLPEHKGARFVRYSQTCPRMVKGAFSWNTINAWVWREKLRTWAHSHDCTSFDQVRGIFGKRWAYHHRETILAVDATTFQHFPSERHLAHVLLVPICQEIPEDVPVSFNAPLEENRFAFPDRHQAARLIHNFPTVSGSENGPFRSSSEELETVEQEIVGKSRSKAPRHSRKYVLNVRKDYGKFYRQPVML